MGGQYLHSAGGESGGRWKEVGVATVGRVDCCFPECIVVRADVQRLYLFQEASGYAGGGGKGD